MCRSVRWPRPPTSGEISGRSCPSPISPRRRSTIRGRRTRTAASSCEVEVDVETGAVTVERLVAVEDCGTILNPAIVDGQIRGALAQGVGLALLEHAVYDEQGQPLASTFLDYLLPTAAEMPAVEVDHCMLAVAVHAGRDQGHGRVRARRLTRRGRRRGRRRALAVRRPGRAPPALPRGRARRD